MYDLAILWVYFLGGVSGAAVHLWWMERRQLIPTTQFIDCGEDARFDEALAQLDRVMVAKAAWMADMERQPDAVH